LLDFDDLDDDAITRKIGEASAQVKGLKAVGTDNA
jgi:hypothetical protein